MSHWYYSDVQRNRHGPVSADDLLMLHGNGQLAPETLVWREGLADWVPWREAMAELLPGTPATPGPARATFATASGDADPHVSANPYEVVERSSPYAPPRAQVDDGGARVVTGGHVVYGGFWKRFAASTIDSFVTGILNYGLLIPMAMLFGIGASGLFDDGAMAALGMGFVGGTYAISILVPALYFGWMQSSSTRASLGKMAVGLKLVRTDGSPVGFWRAFLRYVALVASFALTCGLGAIISAVMVAASDRKQALHDLVCDTLVVDKFAFTDRPDLQRDELGVVTIVVLAFYGLVLLAVFGAIVVAVMVGANR